jgi:hypothetical protein
VICTGNATIDTVWGRRPARARLDAAICARSSNAPLSSSARSRTPSGSSSTGARDRCALGASYAPASAGPHLVRDPAERAERQCAPVVRRELPPLGILDVLLDRGAEVVTQATAVALRADELQAPRGFEHARVVADEVQRPTEPPRDHARARRAVLILEQDAVAQRVGEDVEDAIGHR